ncbi:MAG: hypothetical protein CW716_03075 [Candidatus Bathyarchaeum sp.]|nr:MAG: hypothetical protein CW716_03075 [Candidatus Bathyarchaeum sp.]
MRSSFKLGVTIGILTIISAMAGWYFCPRPIKYNEGFEQDFGGWTGDADVPPDPNNPGSNVYWNVSRTTSPTRPGQQSVKVYIDGKQDDGTVWIEKAMSTRRNAQIQVKISFDVYSENESLNVIAAVVGFAGTSNPETEADFAVLGQANEVSGWKRYTHTITLKTDSSGEVWVALGISVRWETEMTYNIDDIEVTIG